MNLKQLKKALTYTLMISLGLTITACSGDGNSNASFNINSSNKAEVIAALFDSIDTTTPQLPSSKSISNTQDPLAELLSNYDITSTSDSYNTPYTCEDGGSISYDVDRSTIIYSYCQESGVTTNGEVKVSYDEVEKKISYILSDYTLTSETKEYSTSSTSYTISNGHISYSSTGKVTQDDTTTEFDGYNYNLSLVDGKLNIAMDGSIKTTALGDWVNIQTDNAIRFNDNTCPSSGDIEIQGSSSNLKVAFKNDKSIDILLNGELDNSYRDCSEIPALVGVQETS